MTDINIAELRALATKVERYEDGTAIHTSGDETCVDDCAACQYEGAAGRVLLGLLDKLERYEAEPQPGDDLIEWAKNHPLCMWREISSLEATNARYYDALEQLLGTCREALIVIAENHYSFPKDVMQELMTANQEWDAALNHTEDNDG